MGIKGKILIRTLILATSYLLVAATTTAKKYNTRTTSDGSSANSFHPVIQQRHLLAQVSLARI
jgi:hypothetical protein